MLVEVNVLEEDITGSRDCKYCPVAKALSRLISPDILILVHYTEVWFNWPISSEVIDLPLNVTEWIENNDNFFSNNSSLRHLSERPRPISFQLDVPEKLLAKA